MTGKQLESCRVITGPLASDRALGFNGAFDLRRIGLPLWVVCADGMGWEHVSVSVRESAPAVPRCPTWEEMCQVKDLFWGEEECVVQYHPPASMYVNNHAHCLHLWRPSMVPLPVPPAWMVGTKLKGVTA